MAQSSEQAVRDKLDELRHEGGIHPNQGDTESLAAELAFERYGVGHNPVDGGLASPQQLIAYVMITKPMVNCLIILGALTKTFNLANCCCLLCQACHVRALLTPKHVSCEDAGNQGQEMLAHGTNTSCLCYMMRLLKEDAGRTWAGLKCNVMLMAVLDYTNLSELPFNRSQSGAAWQGQNNMYLWQRMVEAGIQQTGEVGMQAFITRDELIGEGEPGHQATLLQPEDGAEAAREMDALNAGKCHLPHAHQNHVTNYSKQHNAVGFHLWTAWTLPAAYGLGACKASLCGHLQAVVSQQEWPAA